MSDLGWTPFSGGPPRFFGYWFAVLGGSGALFGIGLLVSQLPPLFWQETTGVLASARVDDSEGACAPEVGYTYRVGGSTLEGDVYSTLRVFRSRSWAEKVVASLEQEQRTRGHIRIYYDPRDVSRSALDVTVQPFSLLFIGWPLFFLGSGLGMVFRSARRRLTCAAIAISSAVSGFLAIGAELANWPLSVGMGAVMVGVTIGFCLIVRRLPAYARGGAVSTPPLVTETEHRRAMRIATFVGLIAIAGLWCLGGIVAVASSDWKPLVLFGGVGAGSGVALGIFAFRALLGVPFFGDFPPEAQPTALPAASRPSP